MYMERLLGYSPSIKDFKKDKRGTYYIRGFTCGIKHFLFDRDMEDIADINIINFKALLFSDDIIDDRKNGFWYALFIGYVNGYYCSLRNIYF